MRVLHFYINGVEREFSINGILGRGTKSIVYKAVDDKNKKYIIKELFPQILENDKLLIRKSNGDVNCKYEGDKRWNKIKWIFSTGMNRYLDYNTRNPQYKDEIIQYSEVINAYGTLYVVAEDIGEREWKIPILSNGISDFMNQMILLCDCVGHLNCDEKQLVVMDIKADNFVYGTRRIKLADTDGLVESKMISDYTKLIFTDSTAPPEVILRKYNLIGTHSDVYAIAAMIYNSVTGLKFDGKTSIARYNLEKAFDKNNVPFDLSRKFVDQVLMSLNCDWKKRPENGLILSSILRGIME